MTLLGDVVAHCEQRNVQLALVGAAAMTVYGVSRTTFDTDLMTVDRAVLRPEFWSEFVDPADVRGAPALAALRVTCSGFMHVIV